MKVQAELLVFGGAVILTAAGASAIAHPFTDIGAGLEGLVGCSLSWGDYDNDGDLDLAIAGSRGSPYFGIWRNDGGDVFTETILSPSSWIDSCSVSWGDCDNDGDLDLAAAGYRHPYGRQSSIYRNDAGSLTRINAGLTAVDGCSLSWGDYDNDGDLDLAIAGQSNAGPVSQLYRNDGGNVFTDIGAGLTGLAASSLSWGDYDNDGDLDLAIAGVTTTAYVSKIYRNEGGEVFTDIGAALTGLAYGTLSWGDYDNDGDLDLAIAGIDWTGGIARHASKIYRNDGGGFVAIGAGLVGLKYSSLSWGDYDNDGDLDLAIAGNYKDPLGTPHRVSKIYRNDGGAFIDIGPTVIGVAECSLSWGDYDNDGDLDLAIAGRTTDGDRIAKIYRNDGNVFNTSPASPAGLAPSCTGDAVTLSWSGASDDETPAPGLSYNLRVGTDPGGEDVMCGMANLATGWRRIFDGGNAQRRLSWTLRGLQSGTTYYWSVQALDTAFAGSTWAAEETILYYQLQLALVNDPWGDVQLSPEPASPNLPTYLSGTEVTLTAEPNEGKIFKKYKVWDLTDPNDANYPIIDTNSVLHLTMDRDWKVKAIFKCGGGGIQERLPLLMVLGLLLIIRRRR